MEARDINLFNKAIHTVKALMKDLAGERKDYHKQIDRLTKKHDKKIIKMLEEGREVLNELYELFSDLYNNKGGN